MNIANYQEIIGDLESKSLILQMDCDNLRESLNAKSKHLRYVLDTISVLKGLVEIESLETANSDIVADNKKHIPVKMADIVANQLESVRNEIAAPKVEYNEHNQSKITLLDGSEAILSRAGEPLHADILVERLKDLGRYTKKRNLNSALLKDSKQRFVLRGANIFDLRNRQPHTLFSDYPTDLNVSTKLPTAEFMLIDAARDVIKEMNGREFTVLEIFEILCARFPQEINENRRRSVGSTINNLMLKGELEKTRVGTFDKPALYKVVNKG